MNHHGNHYIIAVIGAGIAGLGAATTLLKEGYKDIIILEAQSTPGGRIKTLPFENSFLELGAQWLHGTNNSLYRLAQEHDLLSSKISNEGVGIYIRDDGYIFDDCLVKKVDFEVGKILGECEKFVECHTYPYSVGHFLETSFKIYLEKCNDMNDIALKKLELLDWHLRFQVIDNSCTDLKQLSAKSWGKYYCVPDSYGQEHINLKNGYKSLLEVIISDFPPDVIKYNCEVSKICWKSNSITLQCLTDEYITCDHVIITTSLGVLKQGSIEFDPSLPSSVSATIDYMGYNAIGKIFLIFDCKWWSSEGFQLIWRKDSQLTRENRWTRFITGFDTVLNNPNVLLGWVGGPGVSVMESLSELDVGIQCIELLRRFLQKSDIPYPRKVIKSKWLSNKWIKGGYGYATPNCDSTDAGPSTLGQPVYEGTIPRILFAGEAVHPIYFSTTHGAFESGEDQAKFLLNYMRGIT